MINNFNKISITIVYEIVLENGLWQNIADITFHVLSRLLKYFNLIFPISQAFGGSVHCVYS